MPTNEPPVNPKISHTTHVHDGLCCNFQPCDAADVQEPTAQEKEDSTHELLDSNNGTCYSEQHF